MNFDYSKISKKIELSLRVSGDYNKTKQKDIAFHMTDWLRDLNDLCRFYKSPKNFKCADVENILLKFLIHVPNHIAAAAKLMADVGVADIFEVGAVEIYEDKKKKGK